MKIKDWLTCDKIGKAKRANPSNGDEENHLLELWQSNDSACLEFLRERILTGSPLSVLEHVSI